MSLCTASYTCLNAKCIICCFKRLSVVRYISCCLFWDRGVWFFKRDVINILDPRAHVLTLPCGSKEQNCTTGGWTSAGCRWHRQCRRASERSIVDNWVVFLGSRCVHHHHDLRITWQVVTATNLTSGKQCHILNVLYVCAATNLTSSKQSHILNVLYVCVDGYLNSHYD